MEILGFLVPRSPPIINCIGDLVIACQHCVWQVMSMQSLAKLYLLKFESHCFYAKHIQWALSKKWNVPVKIMSMSIPACTCRLLFHHKTVPNKGQGRECLISVKFLSWKASNICNRWWSNNQLINSNRVLSNTIFCLNFHLIIIWKIIKELSHVYLQNIYLNSEVLHIEEDCYLIL